MLHWRKMALAGVLGAGLAVSLVSAQPPGGSLRGQMSEAERAQMREQMQERMLEQARLSEKEKTAARRAMKAKDQARQALADKLTNLRRTANKANPTAAELRQALNDYRQALKQYRQKVTAEDEALSRQLPLIARARCLSLGILDNGLGGFGRMGAMMPGAGPMMPRRGGMMPGMGGGWQPPQ